METVDLCTSYAAVNVLRRKGKEKLGKVQTELPNGQKVIIEGQRLYRTLLSLDGIGAIF